MKRTIAAALAMLGLVEKAASLKKGQRVRFTGALRNISSKRAGAVIDIADATLQ